MDDLISRQAALEKVRTMQTYKLFVDDDMILVDKAEVQTELMMLPPAQPDENDEEFIKLTARYSNGRPYYSIIYLEYDKNGVGHDIVGYSSYSLDVISDYLKKYFMPPAQPEPQWIPVSERLPENNDPVNVTWVNRNPEVYYMDIKDKPFTATAHYHRGYWYWYSSVTQDYLDEYEEWTPDLVDKDVEIIAWMPLPEAYKPNK